LEIEIKEIDIITVLVGGGLTIIDLQNIYESDRS